MRLHTSVFTIGRKSLRAFVIPLQSSRKFVYAYILPVRNVWTARFLRLYFAFLREKDFTLQFSRLMSPRPPLCGNIHAEL